MALAHGMRKVGVIGAGQMGLGIAFVSAVHAKVPVLLHDRSASQIKSGLALMDKLLGKDVSKGKMTQEAANEARDRVTVVDGLTDFRQADVDMVVEAATENVDLKTKIFGSLAAELSPKTILASNTSSISITKIAASTIPEGKTAAHPEAQQSTSRVVGLHFFNPVPVMKLVELIGAVQTSQETLDRARAFAVACGKEVTSSQDVPGFVANALLMPFLNEAIMCLEKGIATRDDIDKTFRLGMAHPMGPLQLGDIGLDTCLAIQRTLYQGTGDSKYRPSVLLERMVDAQWLGKKSGKGFYDYQ
ncbi:3-hydroxyacyl-CoA dehydrogenase [Epithele typhae]|uniref:3-hydroxyacyl-CoA dehydrogenase n=1 Tax=Epithele typhae TaxID=378194 RepID=UPI00200782DA|nr:3-hydroxyacyl-CoA dehydrogenase [Epithele typhae]KAH9925951.1 3-hydroxyacyl-CoA dehydrogenase [Epithele typhae]